MSHTTVNAEQEMLRTTQLALALEEDQVAGQWHWCLAGEDQVLAGVVAAASPELVVLAAVEKLCADASHLLPVRIAVSLPSSSTLWASVEEISRIFLGVRVVRRAACDQGRFDRASQGLPGWSKSRDASARRMTVATDGSVKSRIVAWAWVGEDASYDHGSIQVHRQCPTRDLAVVAELLGIDAAMKAQPGRPLTVLTDSKMAIGWIKRWRRRDTDLPGVCLHRRAGVLTRDVRRMQQRVAEDGHRLDLVWVKAHAGVPLNEGADALSHLARHHRQGDWGTTEDDVRRRAADSATFWAERARRSEHLLAA